MPRNPHNSENPCDTASHYGNLPTDQMKHAPET